MTDPIDRYLRQLRRELPRRARGRERVVAEAEAHLRDLEADLAGEGLDGTDAAWVAVGRFGDPRSVASGFRSARRALAAELAGVAAALTGAAMAAVGASGLLSLLALLVVDDEFVAGAAVDGEQLVLQKLVVGLVGLVVLEWHWWRRAAGRRRWSRFDPAAVAAVGGAAFVLAGAAAGARGVGLLSRGAHHGPGGWLAASVAALAAAAAWAALARPRPGSGQPRPTGPGWRRGGSG